MDASVWTIIIAGAVQIVTIVVTFLTLWVKLKYGVEKAEEAEEAAGKAEVAADSAKTKAQDAANNVKVVEDKIDHNTALTAKIEKQTNGEMGDRFEELNEHTARIGVLETKLESLDKSLTSTRHEMRGHFQTLTNKLDIMSARPQSQEPTQQPQAPSAK